MAVVAFWSERYGPLHRFFSSKYVGDPVAVQDGINHDVGVVEGQLTVDPDAKLLPALGKFLRVKTSGRFVAHVDAVVPGEIVRVNGGRMVGQVAGRGDRHQTPIRSNANGNHVFLDAFAQANATASAGRDGRSFFDL
jgi:hypothetical protein